MINIDYSNGKIRVETKIVSSLFKLPLKLSIQSHVSGNEIWQSQLNDGWWAEFPNNEMNDVVIYDSEGKFVASRRWNVIQDGSELYKTLYLFCDQIFKRGRRPKGIAVGTHDGLFGEWTSDGKPVEFFEGGLGYTNSIVETVIKSWEKEEIKSTLRESISTEELINDLAGGEIDWIHTDVEGYDSKIIMSIPTELLPKMVIFEHENMSEEENKILSQFLVERGYNLNYQKVSCVGIK